MNKFDNLYEMEKKNSKTHRHSKQTYSNRNRTEESSMTIKAELVIINTLTKEKSKPRTLIWIPSKAKKEYHFLWLNQGISQQESFLSKGEGTFGSPYADK